ncbi:MAG TPA: hypothetical protein VGE37_10730 [Archangium sp.]
MGSIDLDSLERKARLRYELGRAARSVLGFAPALLIVAAAAGFGRRPSSAVIFGSALFVLGSFLLWRGKTLHKAVLPGLLAGLIPLTCALLANRGHLCIGGHCSTWCLPACIAGGVISGVVISFIAHRRGMGWQFWAGASGVSLLTGAMGCACIGYSGVIGLAAGYLAGALPWGLTKLTDRR